MNRKLVLLSLFNHGNHELSKVSPPLVMISLIVTISFPPKIKEKNFRLRDVYGQQRFYGTYMKTPK